MDKCPACNADYRGKPVCHRCKSDLTLLLAVEQQAARYLEKALAALENRDYESAYALSGRSCALRKTEQAMSVSRYAALLK